MAKQRTDATYKEDISHQWKEENDKLDSLDQRSCMKSETRTGWGNQNRQKRAEWRLCWYLEQLKFYDNM